MYSKGEDIAKVKEFYLSIFPSLERVNLSNCYVQVLWLLSMGIMIDENDIDFHLLERIIKRDNIDDDLMNFILSNKVKQSSESKGIKFKKPYQFIFESINLSKELVLKKLKEYLEKKWYKGHSSAGWHDTHKSEFNIYSGYWSFESGAIVKILGLDDSLLKDCSYYPYDMVHWKAR